MSEDILDALSLEGPVLFLTLTMRLISKQLLLPCILSSQVLRNVAFESFHFKGALKFSNSLKAVRVGLTAIAIDGEASEDAELFLLLIDDLAKILLDLLESFLLSVTLIHE
jgi:hypothetical protein